MNRKNRPEVAARIAVATVLLGALQGATATEYYLRFGDIQGEVQRPGLEGAIAIDSFSFGTSTAFEPLRQGAITSYRNVRVAARIDFASPELLRATLLSRRVPVTISAHAISPIDGSFTETSRMTLTDAVVTSFTLGGEKGPVSDGGDAGVVTLSISYNAGCFTAFDANGGETESCFQVPPPSAN